METIEKLLDNAQKYHEWLLEALEREEYRQAKTIKKLMLYPEIQKCIDIYLNSSDSTSLIQSYVKILEDKNAPDLKRIVDTTDKNFEISRKILPRSSLKLRSYTPPIDIKTITNPQVIELKAKDLIAHCNDKIEILKKEQEYEYIPNLIEIRDSMMKVYGEYNSSGDKGIESVQFLKMLEIYNLSTQKIREHNHNYDSKHKNI